MQEAREESLQSRCEHIAELAGAFVRRLKWQGRNGAPDDLVIYKGGVFFIEFKRNRSAAIRRAQILEKQRMEGVGASVHFVHNEDQFRRVIGL